MKLIIILFVLLSFTGCNFQKSADEKTNEQIEILNKVNKNLGNLILTSEFEIKANEEELNNFEDGIVPWISIEKPETEIDRLIDADKIIVPYSEVTIIIDYPLNNPAEFKIKSSKNGFTKAQLVLEISKKYHEIYDVEENTAKTKAVPMEKREGLINRNETDGKYGVWGHDIGDLDLSSIEVYKSEDGEIKILLGIES